MNNPFKHVRSGERLEFLATAYNAMLDAAEAHRNRRMNLSPGKTGFDSLYIHVVNETGKSLKRFDVIGLDGPFNTTDLDTFCERIVFRGVIPEKTHSDRFAIIQQDAEPDICVQAWLRPAYDIPGLGEFIRQAQVQSSTKVKGNIKSRATTANAKIVSQLKNSVFPCREKTDTSKMSNEQIRKLLNEATCKRDWQNANSPERTWWYNFEKREKSNLGFVLYIAEEIISRQATLSEFYRAYSHSNVDNVQAILHYMDYERLKKEEDKRKAK